MSNFLAYIFSLFVTSVKIMSDLFGIHNNNINFTNHYSQIIILCSDASQLQHLTASFY